ncbi:hypothetical protein N7513_001364 [Penicillium frequentans]|nr:hypothetical protein N7513_001364 [Penicillium glabrum]
MTILNVDIKSMPSMAEKKSDDPVERRAPRLLVTVGEHQPTLPCLDLIISEAWLFTTPDIYFFFPETARLNLEAIAQTLEEKLLFTSQISLLRRRLSSTIV